jgi:hypothetical protein
MRKSRGLKMQTGRPAILIGMVFWATFVQVFWAGSAGGASGQKRLDALELLGKYAATQDKLESFVMKGRTLREGFSSGKLAGRPWRGRYFSDYDARFDGRRGSVRTYSWGQINPQVHFTKDEPCYESELWDGETYSRYVRVGLPSGSLYIDKDKNRQALKALLMGSHPGQMLIGHYYPERIRIDLRLREANAISVRDKTVDVCGSECYVIEARINKGEYRMWIDPEHGYNIAKIEIERGEGDAGSLKRFSFSLSDVRFRKVQDIWLPVKGHVEDRFEYRDGHYCTDSYELEIKEVVLDPDHDALGSFVPDDVPNGAKVFVMGVEGEYTWQDGEVVDGQGFKVSLDPNQARYLPVLVDKALPDLKGLGLELDPNETKGKMVLVCFWDMQQRPSRNCVQELEKKAELLADRGVFVVLLQARMVDDETLKAWLKEGRITLPVGKIKGDVEAVSREWGVRSLPWLILTDRAHIVCAEGFGTKKLDEELEQVRREIEK